VSTNLSRPAAACPDDGYTNQPNSVHSLVESPREYQLVSLLLSYRWFPTSPIIPSVTTLARTMKCSGRTVRRTVAALEARGLLARIERRAEDNRQMSNEYVLCGALLAAVSTVEASTGRGGGHDRRPSWSTVAGKSDQRKQSNRNSPRERVHSPGSGLLVRRNGVICRE
jgi:hypothetical protein